MGVYNYFEAKKQFENSLKNNTSLAAYGLSLIYYKEDNPFHDMDSAYHYSLLSVESFDEAKEKKHQKWVEKFDYSLRDAKKHRELISDFGYQNAEQKNSAEGYQFFLVRYPWSDSINSAQLKRDSLAFLDVMEIDSSAFYENYLEKYADSKWIKETHQLLYQAQYNETVIPHNLNSYVRFIHDFPSNPLVRDAQFQIYTIRTEENTAQSYAEFIKTFPDNYFIDDAWKKLYQLSIVDYRKKSIQEFAIKYPNFPFPELIKRDLELVGQTLYQIVKNSKYGFMGEDGKIIITPKFQYVQQFRNGLAVAIENNKYGYINKGGKSIIDFQYEEAFDFDQGRAIVQENGYYGLIDVIGNYILKPIYEDIGSFSEGLMYVQDSIGYQYYTLDGYLAFTTVFDEAFSFSNGMARVKKGDKIGYIGKDGNFIASVITGDILHFKDSLFVHEFRDSMNLIHANGNYLFDRSFDQIGILSDHRAIVERDGKYGYINDKGKIVIPLKYIPFSNYMQLGQFINHHAVYKKGEKYAMIDSLGKQVLPALFYGIGTYGKLIPARKGDDWGYVNENVRLGIKYQYDYAYEFIDSVAIVEKDDLVGLINLEGKEVIPMEFQSIKREGSNLFMVKTDGLFGIYSKKGDKLVKPQFEKISEISKNLYQMIGEGTIEYFDAARNKIIKLNQ